MSYENAKTIAYPGFEFKMPYSVDEEGNVYTPWRGGKQMGVTARENGYCDVSLYLKDGKRRMFKVHRLVMETFNPIENSQNFQINHIDGNKHNNNIHNLEWCTRSENLLHAFKTGLEEKPVGEKNPSNKLTEKEVEEICSLLEKKELSYQKIADRYNVSKGTISHIKNRRNWTHISKNYNF
jgi:hypothetical protein